ncbi:hypothetical protein LJC13_03620, partial [Peptostreptococcaceae bacterium OttesenSCG-928-C18]|nr:hypothetical protein [Peptostreptococcaceae bacterium OttesenSCG-928-C18]
ENTEDNKEKVEQDTKEEKVEGTVKKEITESENIEDKKEKTAQDTGQEEKPDETKNDDNNLDRYKETEYWNEIVSKIPTPIIKGFIKETTYRFIDDKKRLVLLFKTEDSAMKFVCSNRDIIRDVVREVIDEEHDVYITLESNYEDISKNRKEQNLKIIQDLFGEDNIEII